MKHTTWRLLGTDPEAVRKLQEELKIEPLLCKLLLQRGLSSLDAARAFLRPSLADLHDPFFIRDMDIAVQRLDEALKNGERILLYGDYDVDGATSVALMYSFLSEFYRNLDYYLPDRDKEGYGISMAGVEYAERTGCSLVIAMDCGIKALAPVAAAKAAGIDFIICDHHLPEPGELPQAVACIDPKRPDCSYPYKDLTGCGLAFKLAQALCQYNSWPPHSLDNLLDLVAVSIACDIVPITGENRILAHFGLKRLNTAPRLGLSALVKCVNRSFPLQINDLVFGVGPVLNAAGRLGDARDAVRVLLAADKHAALDFAGALLNKNKKRQEVDYATAAEARQFFMDLPDWEERRSMVLFKPEWHKGVIGIVASRMADLFHRPAVILTCSEGRAVGSARSVQGFNLYGALESCRDLFVSYGGHAHAAGLQLAVEDVPEFAERFETAVRAMLTEESSAPSLDLCAQVDLRELTPSLYRRLKYFAPFGPANGDPLFWATNLVDTGASRLLAQNHVRLFMRPASGGPSFSGIGFGLADRFVELRNAPFDIAFHIRENEWRGEMVLNLQVKDIRPTVLC